MTGDPQHSAFRWGDAARIIANMACGAQMTEPERRAIASAIEESKAMGSARVDQGSAGDVTAAHMLLHHMEMKGAAHAVRLARAIGITANAAATGALAAAARRNGLA